MQPEVSYPYIEYPKCTETLGITREGDEIILSIRYEDEDERFICLNFEDVILLINDLKGYIK
jgi:hypothetical protein